jgi:hypothetical protein
MVNAEFGVSGFAPDLFHFHAVVKALMAKMADLAEAIPLASLLSIKVIESIVMRSWTKGDYGLTTEERLNNGGCAKPIFASSRNTFPV